MSGISGGNKLQYTLVMDLDGRRDSVHRAGVMPGSSSDEVRVETVGHAVRDSNTRRPSMMTENGQRIPSISTEQDHIRIDSDHIRRGSEHTRRGSDNYYSSRNGEIPTGNHGRSSHRHRESIRDFEGERSVRGSSARTRVSQIDEEDAVDDRYVVPALPMSLAILCCVLNFVLPGFGSMTAAVCVLCCARTDDMTEREKCGSCCAVFGIGVLQLLLVACFLIGWIWSCIWGVTFIGMSASYYESEYNDEYTNRSQVSHHHRHRSRSPLPTPQVVEDQPYPGIRYNEYRLDSETPRSQRGHRRTDSRNTEGRRTRSRFSFTPSNLIYPMRAPSNIAYNSPPPPYKETASPLPPLEQRRSSINHQQAGSQTDRYIRSQGVPTHLTRRTSDIPEEGDEV